MTHLISACDGKRSSHTDNVVINTTDRITEKHQFSHETVPNLRQQLDNRMSSDFPVPSELLQKDRHNFSAPMLTVCATLKVWFHV